MQQVYNLSQAATFLGRSRQTLGKWRDDGVFPPPDQKSNSRVMWWSEETLMKFKETM